MACQNLEERQPHRKSASKAKGSSLHCSPHCAKVDAGLNCTRIPADDICHPHQVHATRLILIPTCVMQKQKQKQQYGSGVGGAADLDQALEAAYQQFGRALGEAPRETARVVQRKLGLKKDTQTPNISQAGSVQQQMAQQRCALCARSSTQSHRMTSQMMHTCYVCLLCVALQRLCSVVAPLG